MEILRIIQSLILDWCLKPAIVQLTGYIGRYCGSIVAVLICGNFDHHSITDYWLLLEACHRSINWVYRSVEDMEIWFFISLLLFSCCGKSFGGQSAELYMLVEWAVNSSYKTDQLTSVTHSLPVGLVIQLTGWTPKQMCNSGQTKWVAANFTFLFKITFKL